MDSKKVESCFQQCATFGLKFDLAHLVKISFPPVYEIVPRRESLLEVKLRRGIGSSLEEFVIVYV